ncbi:DMT family transporter [Phreatobacter aquaticus]|uniref:DMT family transporter n=1 Tax=Phreatobacter aquaticus TaxID=2570229 RepID=A0A4D7QSA7_9HYPH|nr:DMT family transporter [Phreatobacter aquaticus]QCK88124.1 DMT family transporter [Phreatobacter aquaticus]
MPVLSRALTGILLKLCSTVCFTCMSTLARIAGREAPVGEVVFCRSFFALIPLFVMLAFRREIMDAFRATSYIGHIKRGVLGSTGMFCGFVALTLLPLADSTAIGYAAPLMVVPLAAIFLGEKVRVYRWTAVGIGFVGVVVILWPHLDLHALASASDAQSIGAMFSLASAVMAAFSTIQVRRLVAIETTASIVFYFMVLCAVLALVTWPLGYYVPIMGRWMVPGPQLAFILVMVGVFGGLGQIFLTMSYRHADTSLIAPFEYFSMIWAIIMGYFVFSDLPSAYVLTGGAIVVASGIFVIWREQKLGLERARQRKVSTPQG